MVRRSRPSQSGGPSATSASPQARGQPAGCCSRFPHPSCMGSRAWPGCAPSATRRRRMPRRKNSLHVRVAAERICSDRSSDAKMRSSRGRSRRGSMAVAAAAAELPHAPRPCQRLKNTGVGVPASQAAAQKPRIPVQRAPWSPPSGPEVHPRMAAHRQRIPRRVADRRVAPKPAGGVRCPACRPVAAAAAPPPPGGGGRGTARSRLRMSGRRKDRRLSRQPAAGRSNDTQRLQGAAPCVSAEASMAS